MLNPVLPKFRTLSSGFLKINRLVDHPMLKKKNGKLKPLQINRGNADQFMAKVKQVMRLADEGKPLKPSHTLMLADPQAGLSSDILNLKD